MPGVLCIIVIIVTTQCQKGRMELSMLLSELDQKYYLTNLLLSLYKWSTPKWLRWVCHEDRKRQVKGIPSIIG